MNGQENRILPQRLPSTEQNLQDNRVISNSSRESEREYWNEYSYNCIRVGEMFAGIGGFRLGLENANNKFSGRSRQPISDSEKRVRNNTEQPNERQTTFRVVWANEWDKYASQIYRKNFGEKELVENDIKKIDTNNIPDIDLLCGGFPCQPHSLAGKRKGFSDERGEVFHEIVRVARVKRPKMLLLENVKGLLSSEQGRAFGTVLEELGNIGYWCEWKVFNSKYFGVPQNRERVFIVGHLRREGGSQIFPITENYGEVDELQGYISCTVTSRYASSQSNGDFVIEGKREAQKLIQVGEVWEGSQCRVYDPQGIAPTVHKSGGNTEPLIIADRTRSYAGLGRNLESPKPICNTLSGVQKDNLVLLDNLGGNIKQRVKSVDSPAWTLGGSKTGVMSDQEVRRLTEVECERLQGFPDNWTQGVSSTQRYKMLGNAVTVNVVEAIGELILSSFGGKPTVNP